MARRMLWQKLSEMEGEHIPAGSISPAEMLIAKQRWEVSERSVCFKTTKKLLKNDIISGVFLSKKLLKDSQYEQACSAVSEPNSILPQQCSQAGVRDERG